MRANQEKVGVEAYKPTCHKKNLRKDPNILLRVMLGNVYVTSEQGSPVVVLLRNLAGVSPSKLKG